jgi:hypothetical protein
MSPRWRAVTKATTVAISCRTPRPRDLRGPEGDQQGDETPADHDHDRRKVHEGGGIDRPLDDDEDQQGDEPRDADQRAGHRVPWSGHPRASSIGCCPWG